MLKKFKILALTHSDRLADTYEERILDVEIPDQWGKLDQSAGEAMIKLLTHYLQERWCEQYFNCRKGMQQAIHTVTLRKKAIEDMKTAIAHDQCCDDLQQLSKNMLTVNEQVQKEVAERSAQWDKDHPNICDDGYAKEFSPGF